MKKPKNESARKTKMHNEAISEDLGKDVTQALEKERKRKEKKELRKIEIEQSYSYKSIRKIKTWMDEYFLDGVLGFFPVVGDGLLKLFSIPFIYIALFKVKSLPLTIYIIFNILLDVLIGIIPFYIGNVADFFFRSYKKNFELIVGFVEDDREIIRKVNKRAFWIALGILLICFLIYILFSFIYSLLVDTIDWIASFF